MNPDKIFSWTKAIGTLVLIGAVLWVAYQIYKGANKVVKKSPNLYKEGKDDTLLLGINLDEPFAASKRALNWLSEKIAGSEMFPTVKGTKVSPPPGMTTTISKPGATIIVENNGTYNSESYVYDVTQQTRGGDSFADYLKKRFPIFN